MKTTWWKHSLPVIRRLTTLFLNKYVLAFTIFAVWVAFFDKNALATQLSLRNTIKSLEAEKSFLIEEIEETRKLKEDLTKNKEKYAREKYFMKKPGEQVFIIE
ncbi:MAG: septum formation initiator family protein [Saprospiraceae bacterium]|nr:septum formation initiator family protein [Saprospiraceae bacterium]